MLLCRPVHSPLHFLGILCSELREDGLLQVHDCRLNHHLGVYNEGEDGFVFPIDGDGGGDVVTDGQSRG